MSLRQITSTLANHILLEKHCMIAAVSAEHKEYAHPRRDPHDSAHGTHGIYHITFTIKRNSSG